MTADLITTAQQRSSREAVLCGPRAPILPHYHRRDTCTCLNNTTPHSSLPYNASQRLGSSDPRSRRRHIPNFEQTINSNPHLHMPTSPRPGGRGGTYRWSLQLLQVSSSAHISVPFLELNCLFPKVYHELALHYHQGNLSAAGINARSRVRDTA